MMELNHTSKYIAPTIKRFILVSTHPSYSRFCVFKHSTFPSQGVTAKRTRGIVLFLHFQKFTPRCSLWKSEQLCLCQYVKKKVIMCGPSQWASWQLFCTSKIQQLVTSASQKFLSFTRIPVDQTPHRKHCRFRTSRETSSFINPSNCHTSHRKYTS